MRHLFICLLLLLSGVSGISQAILANDTTAVDSRTVNARDIERYKQDSDFNYKRLAEPADNLWNKFWRLVWSKINQALSTKQGKVTAWVILAIAIVVVVAFFVWKVTGLNRSSLFERKSNNFSYSITSDDINTISFDDALQQALASANYKLAIRLLYLQSLKLLADNNFINWQINKTNDQYVHEVYAQPWSLAFAQLTRLFEFTWYGDQAVSREKFDEVKQQFQQFNAQL